MQRNFENFYLITKTIHTIIQKIKNFFTRKKMRVDLSKDRNAILTQTEIARLTISLIIMIRKHETIVSQLLNIIIIMALFSTYVIDSHNIVIECAIKLHHNNHNGSNRLYKYLFLSINTSLRQMMDKYNTQQQSPRDNFNIRVIILQMKLLNYFL